jgi:hypothetical protein
MEQIDPEDTDAMIDAILVTFPKKTTFINDDGSET